MFGGVDEVLDENAALGSCQGKMSSACLNFKGCWRPRSFANSSRSAYLALSPTPWLMLHVAICFFAIVTATFCVGSRCGCERCREPVQAIGSAFDLFVFYEE